MCARRFPEQEWNYLYMSIFLEVFREVLDQLIFLGPFVKSRKFNRIPIKAPKEKFDILFRQAPCSIYYVPVYLCIPSSALSFPLYMNL